MVGVQGTLITDLPAIIHPLFSFFIFVSFPSVLLSFWFSLKSQRSFLFTDQRKPRRGEKKNPKPLPFFCLTRRKMVETRRSSSSKRPLSSPVTSPPTSSKRSKVSFFFPSKIPIFFFFRVFNLHASQNIFFFFLFGFCLDLYLRLVFFFF